MGVETTTSTSEAPVSYPHETVYELEGVGGYKSSAVLQRGDLAKGSTIDAGKASPCQFSGQTDAVIPFRLRVTNTTQGFAAKSGIGFTMKASSAFWNVGPFQQLRAVIGYGSGAHCVEFDLIGRERLALSAAAPIEPGRYVEATGYFLIGNFYTPQWPTGNHIKLRDVVITAGQHGHDVRPTRGAVQLADGRTWGVPLDPISDGGCMVAGGCPPAVKMS